MDLDKLIALADVYDDNTLGLLVDKLIMIQVARQKAKAGAALAAAKPLNEAEMNYVATYQFISAIKSYRDRTSLCLRDAKLVIDGYRDTLDK